MLIGGLAGGAASDRYGRRPCVLILMALNTVFGIASAMAPSIGWFAVIRFLTGLCVGGSTPPLFTLCAEISPSSRRGADVSVVSTFFMIGSVYLALAAWLVLGDDSFSLVPKGWRSLMLIAAGPSAAATILIFLFTPDSASYLASVGKYSEASISLSHYTGLAKSVSDEICLQQMGVVPEASRSGGFRPIVWWVLDHLFKKEAMPTTLSCAMIWFSLSYGSYGISTWISVLLHDSGVTNVYFNALLFAIASFPGNLVAYSMMDVFGSRRLLMWSMMCASVCAMLFSLNLNATCVVAASCLLMLSRPQDGIHSISSATTVSTCNLE